MHQPPRECGCSGALLSAKGVRTKGSCTVFIEKYRCGEGALEQMELVYPYRHLVHAENLRPEFTQRNRFPHHTDISTDSGTSKEEKVVCLPVTRFPKQRYE